MSITTQSSFDLESLNQRLSKSQVPEDLQQSILTRAQRIFASGQFAESERIIEYIDWITALPWVTKTDDVLDLSRAKETLDKFHYGLSDIKERVLEYIAVMKLQQESLDKVHPGRSRRAPILCFVGLVGTGKTTMAYSIAQTLGRKFVRVAFGGLGDPGMLRGVARFQAGGEPGQVIKALYRAKVKNPVVLLDEIDRVVESSRASIMGVLVEMLDPEQNHAFVDSYIDYPFDLSQIMFIATANNTTNIATAVIDRLEVIQMPSYTNEEKTIISRNFLLPKALEEAGIPQNFVKIDDNIWPDIVRPLGFDAGMRTMERTIQGMVRKIAKQMVEGKTTSFQIDATNIKQYLPIW